MSANQDTAVFAPTFPPARASAPRRRLAALVAVLGTAIVLALAAGASGASADLDHPRTAGHTVVEPGETLWDLAVEHAPAGVDTRDYLARVRTLNGFDSAEVPAWTVVLLPEVGAG